jgi:hypothetical protein
MIDFPGNTDCIQIYILVHYFAKDFYNSVVKTGMVAGYQKVGAKLW